MVLSRKERERLEMRKRILDASKKLFLSQGYEKTSIRNIADEIEYSPSTIYLYFKDKNDLFLALHNDAFNVFFSELIGSPNEEEPLDRMISLGRRFMKFGLENPELYELLFIMEAPMESLEHKDQIWVSC